MLNGLSWAPKNTKRRGDTRQFQAQLALLGQFPVQTSPLSGGPAPAFATKRIRIRLRYFFLSRGYGSPFRYLFLSKVLYAPSAFLANSNPKPLALGYQAPGLNPKVKSPQALSLFMGNKSTPTRATLRLFYLLLASPTTPYMAKTKFNRRLTLTPLTHMIKTPFATR